MQFTKLTTTLTAGGLALAAGPLLAQTQEAKLETGGGRSGDLLGSSVAIDGDTVMMGAIKDLSNGIRGGSVFVFNESGGVWSQGQRLTSSTPEKNDDFGSSVDFEGTTAIVGAPMVDQGGGGGGGLGNPMRDWGAAYIFELGGGTWSQTNELTASDDDPFDYFGTSVAISGNTVAIGAKGANNGSTDNAGAVYVFVRSGFNWVQQAKLTAADGAFQDAFGVSVDIDGDLIVVGAQNGDGAVADTGSAYVFERSGSSWSQITELNASDGAVIDRFGGSVSISGDNIAVGARVDEGGTGAVYLFRNSGGSWTEEAKVVGSDSVASDFFGTSVSLAGDTLLVGTDKADAGASNSGAGYVFERNGGAWSQVAKLVANDPGDDDGMGYRVATDGTLMLCGAIRGDGAQEDTGAGYLFSVDGDVGMLYCFCPTGVCGNPDALAGCANSTGSGALLTTFGSASVSADDLTLSATGMTANQFGLMFMGLGQGSAPFGDGQLCITAAGGELYRYAIRNSGGSANLVESGIVGTSQTFNSGGQIAAGQTWNFQCWFRDPSGPCSSGFNTSNGVSITFVP